MDDSVTSYKDLPLILSFLPCAACGRGFYKSSSQDLQCSRCPAHSFNDREGSWLCDCEDGYYRALSDPPSVACTSKFHKNGCWVNTGQITCWVQNLNNPHMHQKHPLVPSSQPASVSWKLQMCSIAVLCPPVCHHNYVCRLTCLFSVSAAC